MSSCCHCSKQQHIYVDTSSLTARLTSAFVASFYVHRRHLLLLLFLLQNTAANIVKDSCAAVRLPSHFQLKFVWLPHFPAQLQVSATATLRHQLARASWTPSPLGRVKVMAEFEIRANRVQQCHPAESALSVNSKANGSSGNFLDKFRRRLLTETKLHNYATLEVVGSLCRPHMGRYASSCSHWCYAVAVASVYSNAVGCFYNPTRL